MQPELRVPTFARLDEYVGVWSIMPEAFRASWDAALRMDLRAHIAGTKPPELVSKTEIYKARNGQSIAQIPVTGTLMKQQSSMGGTSTVQLRRDIRQAALDPNIGAILLQIDSPGGTVAGTFDLAGEISSAKKAKPVWAHVDELAASAAYWVASQADQIVAGAPTALVGSIGTLMTIYDQSAAAEQNGVKALVFSTGPIKGAGTPGSKVTDEQQAYFQSIVNGMQAEFDTAVRKGRGMNAAQLSDVRTGAVWKAPDAQSKALIDGVASLGKVLDDLAKAAAGGGKAAASHSETLPMLAAARRGALPMIGR